MPLGSVTLRTGISESSNKPVRRKTVRNKNVKKSKSKDSSSKQSTISALSAKVNVKRPATSISKNKSKINVKRPGGSNKKTPSVRVRKKSKSASKKSKFDPSIVKRPSVSKRVIKADKNMRDDGSLNSEDTFDGYRKRIMADRIISIHGDSIDRDNDSDCSDESESISGSQESQEALIESDEEILSEEIIDSYSDSDDSSNESDSEESIKSEIQRRRDIFIEHMEEVIDTIKNMRGGDEKRLKADPSYEKCAVVKKNNRFKTFLFCGHGCKNLLRIFMKRTVDDSRFGYKRIVQILDKQDYRRFMPINDWRRFWKTYETEPVKLRRMFEVILSDMPCKPYLDIEWNIKHTEMELYGSAKKMDFSEFVLDLTTDIIDIFRERYKIDLDETNVMISSSHSDKKVSFHVVVNKIIDGSTVSFHTNLRTEHGSAWDLCNALIEKDEDNYLDRLDEAVYTTDREFRAIFSNKSSDFRPISPHAPHKIKLTRNSRVEMDVDECLKYIITYAKDNQYHIINVPSYEEDHRNGKSRELKSYRYGSKSMTSRYSSTYGSSTTSSSGSRIVSTAYDDIFKYIPQIYDNEEINRILKMVRNIHPTAQYTGTTRENRWRFTYLDRSEPCYTGSHHNSNGFYVFKNEVTGRIYMKCMSESCKDESHTLKSGNCSKTYTKRFV
jgi:hypothetical protein